MDPINETSEKDGQKLIPDACVTPCVGRLKQRIDAVFPWIVTGDLLWLQFFYRQLDFPSEPGVANEILENEP